MVKKNVRYTEVELASTDFSKSYKNPLTKVYQYEYALVTATSELFYTVNVKSLCIETLKMYFNELPRHLDLPKPEEQEVQKENKRRTREQCIAEINVLVVKDVLGNITFPMMGSCAAELTTIVTENGCHEFIYSDGIYAFSVSLEMTKKGRPKKINVRDLSEPNRAA